MGYALGFAGGAGADFAERQMGEIIKRRMWEQEMAAEQQRQQQIAQAEQVRAEQAARGLNLEEQRNRQSEHEFTVNQSNVVAQREAQQAAKDATDRRWYENLSAISNPAQQRLAEALHAGVEGTDIHAYEDPAAHQAHITAEADTKWGDTKREIDYRENLFRGRPKDDPSTGLTPYQQLVQTRQLQKDWRALNAPLRTLKQAEALMDVGLNAAAKGDLNAGSQAVLVTFQKILDPNSVVRETEYFRTAAGQSLLSRIQGGYERLRTGGAGVPASELQQFRNLAKEAIKRYQAGLEPDRQQIRETAAMSGLNPDLIARDDEPAAETQAPAPSDAGGPPPNAETTTFKNGKRGWRLPGETHWRQY